MFSLARLSVTNFRGFRKAEEFSFDLPLVALFGGNATCKSSTANAVEWGLFGSKCTGQQTGIRERIGWTIANVHVTTPVVQVQLEIVGPEGSYLIDRTLQRHPRKAAEQELLELYLPDGSKLTAEAAAERLAGLLQSSFRDFLTTVYQHQEVIRAVLTQEPKERNDAFDRLLGLSDQRNLLTALDGTDLRTCQKSIAKSFIDFEEQVQAGLVARENDLGTLRQEATEAGIPRAQLTGKAALAAGGKIAAAVCGFAVEAALQPPELPVPGEWAGLVEFDKLARKAISSLRSQVPGIEEQKQLLKRRQQMLLMKTALESLRKQWADLGKKCRDLDKEHGGRKAIDAKVAEASEKLEAEQEQLRRTSGRAAVVNEALSYLDDLGDAQAPCPVCETAVPGLVDKLKDVWATKLQALVERITVKINALKLRLKELRGIATQYQKLNEEGERIKGEQTDLRERTGQVLNTELGPEDDALALLGAELSRLDDRLGQLGQAIQDRQERLDGIGQELDRVRLMRDYLHLEEKKQVLETIQQSEAFKQLERIRDQVAELAEDGDAIQNAVAEVARAEAESSLETAGKNIDQYFRQLTRHPAVEEVKLVVTPDKRTRRNHYEVTDQNGKDLTPILSQGDLNALALAIFLGLATSAGESAPFGFLILDDPSQSLGSEHKKQLAQLLDQVARHKRLIVSTMDAEFHDYLEQHMTRAKRQYRFGKWTPEDGPSITLEEDAVAGRPAPREREGKPRLVPTRR